MVCYSPRQVFVSPSHKTANGKKVIVFSNVSAKLFEKDKKSVLESFAIPCGQCIGCRIQRSRIWSMRCSHEAQLWKDNIFLTLTYNPESVPRSLVHRDVQLFLKRLRKYIVSLNPYSRDSDKVFYDDWNFKNRVRYFMCGEYGEKFSRPHYHLILFNFKPKDMERRGRYYVSETISKLWPKGFHLIGDVNYKTCNYVARYIFKKFIGPKEQFDLHYDGRVPEYIRMSTNPGIAYDWYVKFKCDLYPHDRDIICEGGKVYNSKVSPYFDRQLEKDSPDEFALVKSRREYFADFDNVDFTFRRLKDREKCAKVNFSRNVRSYDDGLV